MIPEEYKSRIKNQESRIKTKMFAKKIEGQDRIIETIKIIKNISQDLEDEIRRCYPEPFRIKGDKSLVCPKDFHGKYDDEISRRLKNNEGVKNDSEMLWKRILFRTVQTVYALTSDHVQDDYFHLLAIGFLILGYKLNSSSDKKRHYIMSDIMFYIDSVLSTVGIHGYSSMLYADDMSVICTNNSIMYNIIKNRES